MRRIPRLAVAAALLLPTLLGANGKPLAVSPGDADELALVEARCPTFSWGAIDGAEEYELVVYRFGERPERRHPVLRKTLPGSVTSWTPSLASCLDRGGRYAWSVRGSGSQQWSAAAFFQVAAGPSAAEFEQALAVVRDYLAAREPAAVGAAAAAAPLAMTAPGGDPDTVDAPPGTFIVVGNGNAGAQTMTLGAACQGCQGPGGPASVVAWNGGISIPNSTPADYFLQMDTRATGAPPASTCDEQREIGRVIYAAMSNRIYICDDTGWRSISAS